MAAATMAFLFLVGAIGICALLRVFSADVYDMVIVWMTAKWYSTVFNQLNSGDRVLDVGIGTATALVKNKELLLAKRLSVIGLDYDAAYVRKAETQLRAADLWREVPEGTEGYMKGEFYCRVVERDIYEMGLDTLCGVDAKGDFAKKVPEELKFNAIYFSGSITVMPDPVAALKAVVPLMKSDGRIYITQTFQKYHNSVIAAIKPLLKHVLTIDFGQLTTEKAMEGMIAEAGIFETLENRVIEGSVNTPVQTARLIVLAVKPGAS